MVSNGYFTLYIKLYRPIQVILASYWEANIGLGGIYMAILGY